MLWAYCTSLFEELNAESKCLSENFKLCMCDHYDVFNMLPKIEQCTIFFVDIKKEKNKHVK